MVPAQPALRNGHSPKLSLPGNKRRIKEPTCLQVSQQRVNRLIHFGGMLGVIGLNVLMRVPGIGILIAQPAVIELHHSHSTLHQPPRHNALPRKGFGDRVVQPIKLSCGFTLSRNINRLWRHALHAVSQLVRFNSSCEFRIPRVGGCIHFIQLVQQVKPGSLRCRIHPGRRIQIDDRYAAGPKNSALIRCRHKPGAPVGRPTKGRTVRVVEHHKGRKILVLGPQSITHPGSQAGESHPDHSR